MKSSRQVRKWVYWLRLGMTPHWKTPEWQKRQSYLGRGDSASGSTARIQEALPSCSLAFAAFAAPSRPCWVSSLGCELEGGPSLGGLAEWRIDNSTSAQSERR